MGIADEPAALEKVILMPPFRPEGAAGWVAALPIQLHALTDNNEEPYRSRLQLFEDDRELGPAHAIHDTIRRAGRGSFSFWSDVLYFSTSENTDPNTNGRIYSVALAPLRNERMESEERSVSHSLAWERPERPLRCAVFGVGNRGVGLAKLAQSFEGVEIAWVVDRSEARIASALDALGDPHIRGNTEIWQPLTDPDVDAVFVTVPDHLHRQIAETAFLMQKHVFLEKPLATTAADAKAILSAWQKTGRILQLGYVLRQAPFYRAIRELIRDGVLGPVRIASLSEQLDVGHGASFMRRWHRQSAQSGGLIVHKACHDLDIICWLLQAKPTVVSSFGRLDTFASPPPAPFCSQCTLRRTCPYVDTGLHERRTPAEIADPSAFGLDRCVFGTDKDIIDNQVVSFELDNGTRGNFYLAMQGPIRSERRITLIGDHARLDGVFEDGRFRVTFADPSREPINWSVDEQAAGSHGGGDRITMFEFLNACAGRSPPPVNNAEEAIAGLTFALAAERARKTASVVRIVDDPGIPSATAEKLSNHKLVALRFADYHSEISKADTVFLSVMCSGRTWVRFFLQSYLEQATGIGISLVPRSIPGTGVSPSVCFTHDFLDLFETISAEPWIVFEPLLRQKPLILMTRDVRDIAVSWFFYLRASQPGVFSELVPSGSISEFIDSPILGIERLARVQELEMRFFASHPGPKIHLAYEGLHGDPRGEFDRVLSFLTKRPVQGEAFERALQSSQFSEMQALEIQISQAGRAREYMRLGVDKWSGDINDLKVRSGKVGRFREFLPDLDNPEVLSARYPNTARTVAAHSLAPE